MDALIFEIQTALTIIQQTLHMVATEIYLDANRFIRALIRHRILDEYTLVTAVGC